MLLSHAKWLSKMLNLIEKLLIRSICCEVRLAEEDYELQSQTLYLTDCATAVQELCKEGLPVLAYLHEENQGENQKCCSFHMRVSLSFCFLLDEKWIKIVSLHRKEILLLQN